MKSSIKDKIVQAISVLFCLALFIGLPAVLVHDGLEHYELTKGVVWNNDLQELRHKHSEVVIKLAFWRVRLAQEQAQDKWVEMTSGNTRIDSDTYNCMVSVNRYEELESRYRVGHNRTLTAFLARDLQIAGPDANRMFQQAYTATAL